MGHSRPNGEIKQEKHIRRPDGTGCIYRRHNVFWIKYHRNGKPHYENTHVKALAEIGIPPSRQLEEVTKLLNRRLGEIAEGRLPGIYFNRVTFEELAKDFITGYRVKRRDTTAKAERSVRYLKQVFGKMKATEVTTDKVKEYIDRRMKEGMSDASINRELAALKRMFFLGTECTPPKVSLIPYIPMFKESNVRVGFFERDEYEVLKDALSDVMLSGIIAFAYHSGWRRNEILELTWPRISMKERIARLDPGKTKNEEGRILYMNEELIQEMRAVQNKMRLGCPYVFHRDGKPIRDFREAWKGACIKAGLFEVLKDDQGEPIVIKDKKGNERTIKVPTKIFHDFRRTAIRNMVRAGIPERVGMKISGHKTRSVFERYNIVSDQDLKEAAVKQEIYIQSQKSTVEHQEKKGQLVAFKKAENE